MKQCFGIILLGILMSILTACSSTDTPLESNDTSTKEIISESWEETVSESSSEQKDEGLLPQQNVPSYYGTWEVTSCAGTSQIYALSQQQIDDCIGKQIFYGENIFISDGLSVEFSGNEYEEEPYPIENFSDYKISAADFGITKNELLFVNVLVEGNIKDNLFLGNYFWVIDDSKLLIYCEGVFFFAEKVE